MPITSPVVRVILDAGHGFSNATPHVFDYGAESPWGKEYEIVAQLVDAVDDRFFRDENAKVTVISTPTCSEKCLSHHPLRDDGRPVTHLSYRVQWINDNALKHGDFVLSIHMDDLGDESRSGVCVVYDDGAVRDRAMQALHVSRVVAGVLGIPSRGAMADVMSARKSIAIVEKTHPPALLIEMGNICNPNDVQRVKECGGEAIVAAIEAIRTWKP